MKTKSPARCRFRLTRYFTIASLVAFTVVGVALFNLQNQEVAFFEQVQADQNSYFAQAQVNLSSQQEITARKELLALHEAGHVNLTRVLANMLWETNIVPVMAKVQQIPSDHCRRIATSQADIRKSCFAEIGRKITALPAFSALDTKAYTAMRTTTVFKIKVFDLRGITIYSSEHAQIGDDKAENLGWKTAVSGQPASEFTHRDRFSAFEGVVENRDLISSYIPVRAPGKNNVIGVFEIYSDVTPFLNTIKEVSAKIREVTVANQAEVERVSLINQQKVQLNSDRFLAIVGSLFALLYVTLLLVVRNGQRIIDQQRRAQEQSARREQQWHQEKMAALATMAARVSHEMGNPLATIAGLAEDIAKRQEINVCLTDEPRLILEQTQRIAAMIRQVADFAANRREQPELVDINQMIKAVCDFLSFDNRFNSTRIEFRPDSQLPACIVIPSHLNEVLINILQGYVEDETKPQRILVETKPDPAGILIRINGESAFANAKYFMNDTSPGSEFQSVRRRVADMGGNLVPMEAGIGIILPMTEAAI